MNGLVGTASPFFPSTLGPIVAHRPHRVYPATSHLRISYTPCLSDTIATRSPLTSHCQHTRVESTRGNWARVEDGRRSIEVSILYPISASSHHSPLCVWSPHALLLGFKSMEYTSARARTHAHTHLTSYANQTTVRFHRRFAGRRVGGWGGFRVRMLCLLLLSLIPILRVAH